MATVTKDFRVKSGLVVEGSTATVNGKNIITAGVVDAKGDLIVGSADDAVARLGIGTNGQVLTANSSATYGVEWSAPAAVGVFDTSITFEGATANDYETTLTVVDPTADRTITLPDATGTVALTSDVTTHGNLTEAHGATGAVVGTTNTQTLTNKTLTSPKINEDVALTATATELNLIDGSIAGTVVNSKAVVYGSAGEVNATTLQIAGTSITASAAELNYVDGVTSAIQTQLDNKASSGDLTTHANLTEAHGATGAVVGTTNTQTLTNKTLTSPVVSGLALSDSSVVFEGSSADNNETTLTVTNPTADRTITLPDATGTVALTNNKLDVFAATSSAELISVISDETGTGALVFANTPTLVTPNIGAATGTSLVLSGDLTVNGTTTTINSTEITVDDKNLTLGSVATPTDAGADGGGLTLKGTTDKTFSWIDATDSWTSSEHVDLASGKVLKINGTEVLSATQYTGNAATVTNGITTASKISALAATSSSELAGVISDETGTGALVFANTPTLVTPAIGAATGTSLVLSGALTGTAVNFVNSVVGSNLATAGTSTTNIDAWAVDTYSSAKYIVQMKKGSDIEVIEVLVTVDGSNNVYLTEYANVISNASLGTTDAVYSGGNVVLQVTAAANDTSVKVHKVYIEA
jgi:ribosomal protein L35AE/L33A